MSELNESWKFLKSNSLRISMKDSGGYAPHIHIESGNKIRCKILLLDNMYAEQSKFPDILNKKELSDFNNTMHIIVDKKTERTLWNEVIDTWKSKDIVAYKSLKAQGKIPDKCPDYTIIKDDSKLLKEDINREFELNEELRNINYSLLYIDYFNEEYEKLKDRKNDILLEMDKFGIKLTSINLNEEEVN